MRKSRKQKTRLGGRVFSELISAARTDQMIVVNFAHPLTVVNPSANR